uniref:Uncharacterized protein n=1 Tax=Pithovirus LCDPAC02 TaxID=2506601 RepID=A0A481YR69_9VIRU|nr:MAG: hypothetical protein LCDPAC02_01350 [Pithovirus LCDPAC02]
MSILSNLPLEIIDYILDFNDLIFTKTQYYITKKIYEKYKNIRERQSKKFVEDVIKVVDKKYDKEFLIDIKNFRSSNKDYNFYRIICDTRLYFSYDCYERWDISYNSIYDTLITLSIINKLPIGKIIKDDNIINIIFREIKWIYILYSLPENHDEYLSYDEFASDMIRDIEENLECNRKYDFIIFYIISNFIKEWNENYKARCLDSSVLPLSSFDYKNIHLKEVIKTMDGIVLN